MSEEQTPPAADATEVSLEAELTTEYIDDSLVVAIRGAERLPAGTTITFSIVIGDGGALVVPPAAVPAPEPAPARKPYMGMGGR